MRTAPSTPSPAKMPSSEELAARFRSAGLKATPQRVAIYRALLQTHAHPSPEALHKSVARAMPSVSLATIYKTLDALESAGLIEQVSRIGDTKRYDANMTQHHHLVCTRCLEVTDIELPELDARLPRAGAFPSFTITGMHIQVLGLCEACKKKES